MKNFAKNNCPLFYRVGSNIKFIIDCYGYFRLLKETIQYSYNTNRNRKRIIFHLARPYALSHLFLKSVIGVKLSQYGCNVKVLFDEGILKHHDTYTLDDVIQDDDYEVRGNIATMFLDKLPIYLKYSEFIKNKDLNDSSLLAKSMIKKKNYVYSGINLKPYIQSSLIRFFRSAECFIEENRKLYLLSRVVCQILNY